jgi:FMN reductase
MTDETTTQPAPLRLLGIGGRTRARSLSRFALAAALRQAREAGARTVLADVRALALPVYNADRPLEAYPPTLAWLLAEVRAADAYLLCSPTYHGTVAGGVKNALDALEFLAADAPPYFGGKVVGLMACGGGGANVITSLTHATRALNGLAAPTVAMVPGAAVDPDTGDIRDAAVGERLAAMVGDVIDLARRLRR